MDDVSVVLEMRVDGLWLHRKRTRARLHLSFDRLWHLAKGQGELTFGQVVAAGARAKRARKKAAPAKVLAGAVAAVPEAGQ